MDWQLTSYHLASVGSSGVQHFQQSVFEVKMKTTMRNCYDFSNSGQIGIRLTTCLLAVELDSDSLGLFDGGMAGIPIQSWMSSVSDLRF